MYSVDLLNMKVRHKIFGEGSVVNVSNNVLTVRFANKESKFNFPSAFEKFLVAEDASIQDQIVEEINKLKLADEIQQKEEIEARKIRIEQSTTETQSAIKIKKKKNIEDGFGADYNVKYLAKHPIFTYQQVEKQFGIKIAGFGRGINRTDSKVVLISSVEKRKNGFVYHDHWTTMGDYIYSGEGKTGNQQMTFGNKAIVDAEKEGKEIHLFVKFSSQEYFYQGVFSLIDYSYEDDKDEDGQVRKEYKFVLRKKYGYVNNKS